MKKLILTLLILTLIVTTSNALTLTIPFKCWKSELIKEFAEIGINLDEDDPFSDGLIENCGSSYKIHLYRNPTDLTPFIEIPKKVAQKLKELQHGDNVY